MTVRQAWAAVGLFFVAVLIGLALLAGSLLALSPIAAWGEEPLPSPANWTAPDGRTIPQLIAAHVLPDPTKTPGVINPEWAAGRLTLAQVCTPGWTATVRPRVSWTDKLRAAAVALGHAAAEYELDHLYSIEDLGAPADARNLWDMIYADRYGARVKDVLETKLHRLLCAGKITPADAGAALTPNWLIGYQRYVGPLP